MEPHVDLVLLCVGAFHPLVISEAQGQDSVLSLFLFVVAFVCLRRGRDFWAGAILGLALYKPQLVLPAVFILVVASKRRGLIAAGFGVSCICVVLVSIAAVGWKAALGYPRFLTSFKAVDPNHVLSVYSLAHAALGTQWARDM